jgi:hypothetical protein
MTNNPTPRYVAPHRAAAIIYRMLKAGCETLNIVLGKSSYERIEIRGSGPHFEFTDREREWLTSLGLTPNRKCCLILSRNLEYWLRKLTDQSCFTFLPPTPPKRGRPRRGTKRQPLA